MEPLINFRSLVDELSQSEFTSFLAQCVIQLNAKEIFIKSLFDAFQISPTKITPFSNIISNIIHKRGLQKENNINNMDDDVLPNINDINNNNLHQQQITNLPSSLLSECGSYLNTKEYFRFCLTNRKIYIALHQQPKLSTLWIKKKHRKIQSNPFKVFRNCEILAVDTQTFNESLSFENQSIWSHNDNLHTLWLEKYKGIAIFLQRNLINKDRLKQLVLTNIICNHTTYTENAASLIKILSHFPMIEGLALSRIACVPQDVINSNPFLDLEGNIAKWCENVRTLRLGDNVNMHLCHSLVNVLGDQLEAISISQNCPVITSTKSWGNLKELVVRYPTAPTLDGIMNNDKCINLKRSMLKLNDWENFKLWINNMIMKQMQLELIFIWCNAGSLKSIMEKIESLMLKNKRTERMSTEMTVKLLCASWHQKTMDNLFMNMFRLFHAMELVQSWTDIRLVLVFEGQQRVNKDWNEVKGLLNELESIKDKYLIEYGDAQTELFKNENGYGFRVVISNKNCKINGYAMYHSLQTSIRDID